MLTLLYSSKAAGADDKNSHEVLIAFQALRYTFASTDVKQIEEYRKSYPDAGTVAYLTVANVDGLSQQPVPVTV